MAVVAFLLSRLPGMRLLIELLSLLSEEPERLYHRNVKE